MSCEPPVTIHMCASHGLDILPGLVARSGHGLGVVVATWANYHQKWPRTGRMGRKEERRCRAAHDTTQRLCDTFVTETLRHDHDSPLACTSIPARYEEGCDDTAHPARAPARGEGWDAQGQTMTSMIALHERRVDGDRTRTLLKY